MTRIGLTGPYSAAMRTALHDALPQGYELTEVPTIDDYDKLADVDFVILRTLAFDKETIGRCRRLRMIQKYAVGYDTIDISAAAARNIPVVNCTGINTEAVAEFTILHMLAVLRNLMPLNEKLRNAIWAKDEYVQKSHNLQGRLLGIIGLGSIGKRVCQLAHGFGASVQYYDMYRQPELVEHELDVKFSPLEELLRTSDIVSLHVPFTNETKNMIDRTSLGLMKRGAILINTARGNLVDESALIEALGTGQLAGVGLDVFVKEPPVADSPLLRLENVLVTPHVGGSTAGNDTSTMLQCLSNIVKFSSGEAISKKNIVNLAMLSEPLPIRYV